MSNILNNIKCNPTFKSNKYVYNNKVVPRVTEIIKNTISEEYLMRWSNSLGFKRQSYTTVLNRYSEIGTYTHAIIENYLKNNSNAPSIPSYIRHEVENATSSFFEWFNIVDTNTKYNILGIEDTLICEWFGGTADLLIDVNGEVFLIDFKTSNYITYKHFLQLSVYLYLYSLKNIKIDKLMILQLSKNEIHFNEYIVHLNISDHKVFIDNCINTFFGMVYSYYNNLSIQEQFGNIVIT